MEAINKEKKKTSFIALVSCEVITQIPAIYKVYQMTLV